MEKLVDLLNAGERDVRLDAARKIAGEAVFPEAEHEDVNGHIHTTFSFSPYSPTAAVFKAKMSGLKTAGIMDHDSVGGAQEFIEAGKIFDLPITVGIECRVSMKATPYEDVLINNPDQKGCAYVTMHGVPHDMINGLNGRYAPLRQRRNDRGRSMVERINENYAGEGISLDFDKDVLPLSEYSNGGTVTERHISSALARTIMETAGKGDGVLRFLAEKMGVAPSDKIAAFLNDAENPHYIYDLIGVIKSDVISSFYIPATDELMHICDFVALANEMGAIPCMPYLGDVGDSVTGDKKAQKFEDDYLDEWIAYAKKLGFKAITYMPSRNTAAQIERLRALISKEELWEISGEDINTSRQQFVCVSMRDPKFDNLRTSAYALIAHERRATINKADGIFGANSEEEWPDFDRRARAFAAMVKG
ncbi:MAG: PHP domain-containing protein [Christensenellales bacterium]|jgi:hypothetical protein